MTNKPIIEIKELWKNYGNFTALEDFTLDIYPGTSGIIGPNGAGKTTLIKLILGLLNPTYGEIYIFGYPNTSLPSEVKSKISILFEDPSFPMHFRAGEYLLTIGKIRGGVNYQDVRHVLELVDLWENRDNKIGNFSAGMLQRLGLAASILGDVELVILDEPTSNLDVFGRDFMINTILRLRKETSTSFIIASHILPELERMCDYVHFINEGVLIDSGKMLDIMKKYSKNFYRIVCSDPETLADFLKDEMKSIKVFSRFSIIAKWEKDLESLKQKVKQIAEEKNIEITAVYPEISLEKSFEEAIRLEIAKDK